MALDKDAVGAIATEIRRYLVAHPDAADSVTGIHRWWLPRRYSAEHASVVEQALQRLISENIVRVRHLPNGASVYSSAERDSSARRQ
jgi:hypothetical protein